MIYRTPSVSRYRLTVFGPYHKLTEGTPDEIIFVGTTVMNRGGNNHHGHYGFQSDQRLSRDD